MAKKQTLQERFWEKVNIPKNSPDACWEWTAATMRGGYGHINKGEGRGDGKAHVLSWEWANNKKVKPGECILHICDNPKCVNPNHLRKGSQTVNLKDMWEKGRGRPGRNAGEQNGNSYLKTEQVIKIHELKQKYNYGRGKISKILGIGESAVRFVLEGKTWRHIRWD
jgi:hypothetical protein